MKKVVKLVLLFCAISSPSAGQDLTRNEGKEDLLELKENLEKYHAGFHRYMPADSMNYFFDLAISRLEEDMNTLDLYREVTFLLNKVRCGHTRASLPEVARNKLIANNQFLPLSVKYLGNRLYVDVVVNKDKNIVKGDEILSINGLAINSITQQIFEHHSSDGFINEGKFRLTELYFDYYYQLYLNYGNSTFDLQIRDNNGEIKQVKLSGATWEEMRQLQKESSSKAVLELTHNKEYSYIKIGTFGEYNLRENDLDYEEFLEESFQTLKEKKVKNLVLDLRGNGGGKDNFGALLVSYFADKPFKYFERIEVTDDYSGYGTVKNRDGKNLITSHKGLSTWKPQKNRFEGKVYVLTDGWSFSTCADVATVLHHNQWATFIGGETGGGYDGNTSGNSTTLFLSNSNIRINLPMWMYTTANIGHTYYGRGVIPDYPVTPTVEEFLNDEDVDLKKALELIGGKE